MSAPNSKKRAAPGASPMVPYQQRMQQSFTGDNGVADSLLRWNGEATELFDASANAAANSHGLMPTQPQFNHVPTPSNSLARRDTNQALIPTHNQNFDTSVEPWVGFGDDTALLQQNGQGSLAEQDSIELLEEMAQKAKREAQTKRKSIPPFVQKLSSFLEEGKNEDLIRWSEKGDSFIVLDEDEFAKKLIPELFKHNNYASFVRQLNMYGFHKRVGLSDNSMRASERKNKSPSEYHNLFFRRGHPNLLWLISKPRGKPKSAGKNKNNDGDGDSDDDQANDEGPVQSGIGLNIPTGRSLPAPSDSQSLPKKELSLIREELRRVRESQRAISHTLSSLQHNNHELYNQAVMFQNQHDRHQNSINAILKFLANVFRKTLEDQGNMQSVTDIISSMITNQGQQPSHQGSVVDLGDFFQTQMDPTPTPGGAHKRARGLLPPIPDPNETPNPTRRSPSTSSTPYYPVGSQNPEMGHVTELIDGGDTPPSLRHELENNPHERMMKIINDHNATSKSGMDLPAAAELVANAPDALNSDQRGKLADLMGGQNAPVPPPSAAPVQPTAGPSAKVSPLQSTNARVSPAPAENTTMPSMSPIMRSPQVAPPSLNEINTNQMDLEQLQRLQSEQDAKIHELTTMLGPLSPSGRIPGLEDGVDAYFDAPPVDIDQFFDSNAFLNDTNFDADGNDFNFNIDADGVGSNPLGNKSNGNNTPSPTGTEEIEREDMNENSSHNIKRRKVD
ncbi:Heat shock transcription factor [Conoideocrella luteorostrata]|uniref:Heat shock transcription factor n=1 Tax=Conoideocrella luteorostrata TaxID=1105319 RepID=A0AAJ0CHW8_9HYPO|nr:Heat shock transcription factor [Conoideocrella luteorostrata]